MRVLILTLILHMHILLPNYFFLLNFDEMLSTVYSTVRDDTLSILNNFPPDKILLKRNAVFCI